MPIPAHLNHPSIQKAEADAKAAGLCGARYRRTMRESPWSRVCLKPVHDGNRHSDAAPKADPLEPEGTCQICFRHQQTRAGNLVLHGYKRPGYGYIVGNCYGHGFAPFEVSCDRTKTFIAQVLQPWLARCEARLAELQARPESMPYEGGVWVGSEKTSRAARGYQQVTIKVARDTPAGHVKTEIVAPMRHHYSGGVIVEKGDFDVLHHPSYDDILARAIHDKQSDIRRVKDDLSSYGKKVAEWKAVAWPTVKAKTEAAVA